MIGGLFALGAALSSGVETIFRRRVLIKENSLCYTFAFGLFAAIVLLPLFFLRFQAPADSHAWLLVIASGILWTLYGALLFKAYSYLEASVASPLSKIRLFFVLMASVIILGEHITFGKILGTLMIFAGAIVISYRKKKSIIPSYKKGVFLIIISAFVISAALLIDKYAMNFFNVETYLVPVYLMSPLLLTALMVKRDYRHHLKNIFKRSLIPTILTSILSVGYYYLILYAFKYAEASVVVPIAELSILISVIGGIIFLKERENMAQKIVATVILIMGAILVSGILF